MIDERTATGTVAPPWTRPRVVRYRPGAGLAVGAAGLALLAAGLFSVRWIGGDGGRFADISRSLRHAGSARVGDTLLYGYGAWGAYAVALAAALLVVSAGVPLPRSSAGNTWPRLVGALVCGAGAVVHALFVRDLFAGPVSPLAGAWLGVLGYLVTGAGIALGARRISATY